MDVIVQPSNPVQGVVVGQTATCDIPIGPRYHSFLIMVVAKAAAGQTLTLADVLGLINVKIGGKVQRAHTAVELDNIQAGYGAEYGVKAYNCTGAGNSLALVYNAGNPQAPQVASQTVFFVRVNLVEPWRKTWAGARSRAWYTSWADGSVLPSLQLELTCPNTGKIDGAAAYSMNVFTVSDNAVGPLNDQKQPVNLICKFYRNQVPYTAAGDLQIVDLIKARSGGTAIIEEHGFFCPAGDDITRVIATLNSKKVRDTVRPVNDQLLLDHGFEPTFQNGNVDNFRLVYDYTDIPTDGLVLAANGVLVPNYNLTLTLGAAAAGNKTISVISQVYGEID